MVTNKCVRIIGKDENLRPLRLALFQGTEKASSVASTLEMEVSENPALTAAAVADPILFCAAFKKSRFFLFSRREPEDEGGEVGRDIFNLKPTREEQMAATGCVRDILFFSPPSFSVYRVAWWASRLSA